MPDIDFSCREIEHMRVQAPSKEMLKLQRAGIPPTSAEALLERMLAKIDRLCADRDRLKAEQPPMKLGALNAIARIPN